MNNPIPDATKFLKSLKYDYNITGNTLNFEDSTISVEPSIDAVECSSATMRMVPAKNPAGVRNSFLLFVVVNAVMGKSFDIEGFFAKFDQPPFSEVVAAHGGVRVTFMPTPQLWTIAFHPT